MFILLQLSQFMRFYYFVRNKKGFTLIEILVVVAIISILSGILLSNLRSAKNKSEDSAIIQVLNNARAEAQFYGQVYNDGSFFGLCEDGSEYTLNKYVDSALEIGSDDVNCVSTISDWALEARLSDGTYYCISDIEVAGIFSGTANLSEAEPECDSTPV